MKGYFILFTLFLPFLSISQDKESLKDKGYLAYENEDYLVAIQYFSDALKLDDADPELYYLRGVSKSLIDRNEDAIEDYKLALALKPDYPEVHYEIGYANFLLNKLERALASFSKAIDQNPEYAEAYLNRGTIRCMLSLKEEARQDYEKAKDLGMAVPFTGCD